MADAKQPRRLLKMNVHASTVHRPCFGRLAWRQRPDMRLIRQGRALKTSLPHAFVTCSHAHDRPAAHFLRQAKHGTRGLDTILLYNIQRPTTSHPSEECQKQTSVPKLATARIDPLKNDMRSVRIAQLFFQCARLPRSAHT